MEMKCDKFLPVPCAFVLKELEVGNQSLRIALLVSTLKTSLRIINKTILKLKTTKC